MELSSLSVLLFVCLVVLLSKLAVLRHAWYNVEPHTLLTIEYSVGYCTGTMCLRQSSDTKVVTLCTCYGAL